MKANNNYKCEIFFITVDFIVFRYYNEVREKFKIRYLDNTERFISKDEALDIAFPFR